MLHHVRIGGSFSASKKFLEVFHASLSFFKAFRENVLVLDELSNFLLP